MGIDVRSEPIGYEGAILEARLRGDPFAAQLHRDLDDLRATRRRPLPGYLARHAPSASVGTAVRALITAVSAALSGAATGNLYVAGGVMVVGMVVVPQPPRAPGKPRRSRGDQRRQTDWRAQLERECLEQVVDGYRAGTVSARAALPSYTSLVDWNLRHEVDGSEYRTLLLEAIEAARDAGDTLGLLRLQVRLDLSDGPKRFGRGRRRKPHAN